MDYFILIASSIWLASPDDYANIMDFPKRFRDDLFVGNKIDYEISGLKCQLNTRHLLLDAWTTGTILPIYSTKLINFLKEIDIEHQAFLIEVYDQQNVKTPLDYFAVNFTRKYEVFDPKKSTLSAKKVRFFWLQNLNEVNLLGRDAKFSHVVVVSEDIKQKLEKYKLTGFEFVNLEQFNAW